ncbi:MAG: redoxin domain-containing protein, partial [Deferrisomatales bacterium]|nr:redoxin domain-containing protein [Deferrisomatales bacterium]
MSRLYRSITTLLCLAAVTLIVNSTSAAAFKRVHAGEEAPSFTLPDLDGNAISLDAHREGPLTIVTFWALWSPKSEPLLQDIQKILDEFGDKGLAVQAIAVNEEGEHAPADFTEQVKGLIERHGLKFPVVVDKGMEQYEAWGVIATPSTAFLGKDLRVEYEFSGHPTSAYLDMRAQAMKALGIEEAVATAAKPKRERYHAEHRVLLNYGLTKTLFERGQFSKAQRKLKQVLSEDANFPDAHALSGLIQLGLAGEGNADEAQTARAAFDKAVELDATVPMGLMGQAHFALEDGDTAKALERAQEALKYTEDADLPQVGGTAAEESAEAAATTPQAAAAEPAADAQSDAAAPATETAGASSPLTEAAALLKAG